MPDQSSASTEHAIMQEITAPLSTLPEDPVPVAADVDFPIVLRGYDRIAVDAYVKKTSQLVAELQATRSPEAAVRRALERVGEEVSGILQRAHDTASQITTQSRSEAEDRLEAARREATDITIEAADRVKELDLETDRIWEERLRIVEDARDLARQLLTLADSAAQRFPAEETESTDSVPSGVAEVFAAAAEPQEPADEEPDAGAVTAEAHEPEPLPAGDVAAAEASRHVPGEPTAEEPAAEEPAAEEPAGEEPAEGQPAAGRSAVGHPAAEEPAVQEPAPGEDDEDPDRTQTMIMRPIRPSDFGEHPE